MFTQTQLRKITDEVTKGVKGILGDKLRNVILYGSYARGDYDSESDIDIVVLADVGEESVNELEYKIDMVSSDVSMKSGITVSVFLYDRHLFELRIPISPYYRNVMNDGVTVYAN